MVDSPVCAAGLQGYMRANAKSANRTPIIAIVDDDSGVLRALGRLVGGAGYQTRTFGSAEACLAGLNGTGFDCVITDLAMGKLDGFGLKARLAEVTPKTPVILLTGVGTSETDARAEREGFVACLSKPFDACELLSVIERVVG